MCHVGKVVGDVDYHGAETVAGHITPVPGGIGPILCAQLMRSTYEFTLRQKYAGVTISV